MLSVDELHKMLRDNQVVHSMISEQADKLYQRRSRTLGYDLNDWLVAENVTLIILLKDVLDEGRHREAVGQVEEAQRHLDEAVKRVELLDQLKQIIVQNPIVQQMILERAYYSYQLRGCIPDHELEDWLEAEKDIYETLLRKWLAEE